MLSVLPAWVQNIAKHHSLRGALTGTGTAMPQVDQEADHLPVHVLSHEFWTSHCTTVTRESSVLCAFPKVDFFLALIYNLRREDKTSHSVSPLRQASGVTVDLESDGP